MKNIEVDIPKTKALNDFTIIYKGREEREGQTLEMIEEIKTSKESLLTKLRYFKRKLHEISQQDEIFIHDIYPNSIFKEFISTLTNDKITLNESNYTYLHQLSIKYEYNELREVIEKYSEIRPDISDIIDDYSTFKKFDNFKEEDEEIIAKHLDICLQNDNMLNFPIEILNRILNSPKRIIQNHHLLFQFIKKLIERYRPNMNSNINQTDNDEVMRDNILILMNSLDYSQMSNDELKEILENDEISDIFCSNGRNEKMRELLSENEKKEEQIKSLITHIGDLEQLIKSTFSKQEEMSKQTDEKMRGLLSENEKKEERIKSLETHVSELQQFYKSVLSKQEEASKQTEEKMKEQVKVQANSIKELEMRIQLIEKNNEKLDGKIKVNVQQNQLIKGLIKVTKNEDQLNTNKSKYILNTDNTPELGVSSYNSCKPIESSSQEVSFAKAAGTYYLHALLASKNGTFKELISQPLTTKGIILTYKYTGRVESVTLEPGTYKLEVWGAEGGKNGSFSPTPGKGGYSVGILTLNTPTKFYIHVGESPSSEKGGWNGGGSGTINGLHTGAGGGGSTDISLYGEEGSANWNNENHLYSRIIVAGAGGGSGNSGCLQHYGGFGGGLCGQSSGYGPSENEGTQTKAGTNQEYSICQGFGIGGTYTGTGSSGGGGGWYGGGASNNGGANTGGAGGSGYVYNSSTSSNYPSGCKLNSSFFLTNSKTVPGNEDIPNPQNSSTEKGHSGHGFARITPQ